MASAAHPILMGLIVPRTTTRPPTARFVSPLSKRGRGIRGRLYDGGALPSKTLGCVFALGEIRLRRAIIGVGSGLFGAPLIDLTLVFAGMFSNLPEQVTDECVGEDSLGVEFLADLIEAIIHWVESPCFFAAQG